MRIRVPPVLALAMAFLPAGMLLAAESAAVPAATKPVFTAEGTAFAFDTGVLKGQLRPEGKSIGLRPLTFGDTAVAAPKGYGLLSPYRLLSADARYGTAAWDWTSTAGLTPDGTVNVLWRADETHPLDLAAAYRWVAADTLELSLLAVSRKDLPAFEVFLASYFEGCPESLVYVQERPGGGGPGFMPVAKAAGDWQAFPRDDEAATIVTDGRWKRPPHPVDWKVMPRLAGALAMRRDAARGVVALVMAPPGDCFAILSPHGEEGHRSLYLSMIGCDLKGERGASVRWKALVRARLVIGKDISEARAIELYQAYVNENAGGRR